MSFSIKAQDTVDSFSDEDIYKVNYPYTPFSFMLKDLKPKLENEHSQIFLAFLFNRDFESGRYIVINRITSLENNLSQKAKSNIQNYEVAVGRAFDKKEEIIWKQVTKDNIESSLIDVFQAFRNRKGSSQQKNINVHYCGTNNQDTSYAQLSCYAFVKDLENIEIKGGKIINPKKGTKTYKILETLNSFYNEHKQSPAQILSELPKTAMIQLSFGAYADNIIVKNIRRINPDSNVCLAEVIRVEKDKDIDFLIKTTSAPSIEKLKNGDVIEFNANQLYEAYEIKTKPIEKLQ